MDGIIKTMQEIKTQANKIFDENNLKDKGFIKCNIFGNKLKPHKILLVGINPGDDEKDIIDDPNEVNYYLEHPDYNEFIEENYSLIWGVKKLFKNAFGEENVDFMLKNTFYWNLCLSRTEKKASEMQDEISKANNLYWDLFCKIVENVKPEIILTFVSNVSFLESKLNIQFQNDRIIENKNHKYYWYDNLNINNFIVKKVIGINHLSKTYYNKDEWKSTGDRFKNDYIQAFYQNFNLLDDEKRDLNYDESDSFKIDSFINPVDDLETILFLYKRKSKLKWKDIIMHLHHALYMYSIAIIKGSNPDDVTNSGRDNYNNIFFKKGNDRWKKSRIVRYKDTPLFQFEWDYIDYEPKFDYAPLDENENIRRNLIGFWTAIARIQDGEFYMGRLGAKPISLTDEEKDAIIKLNNYRNKFEHFIPVTWGIEVSSLKKIGAIIINIIERISHNTEFQYFLSETLSEKNDNIINELKIIFNSK